MSTAPDRWKRALWHLLTIRPLNLVLTRPLRLLHRVLPRLGIDALPVVGDVVIRQSGQPPLVLRTDGRDTIASRVYWSGLDAYEPGTVRLFLHLAARARTILDIGANTGLYALLAATRFPAARVIAFEPAPGIFAALRRNAGANPTENLRVERIALADHDGEAELFLPGSVGFPTEGSTLRGFRGGVTSVVVPAATLDAYAGQHDLRDVDLVKIDTEGTEPAVLAGGAAIIARWRPHVICEVLAGRTEPALENFFAARGYRWFRIEASRLAPLEKLAGDPSYRFPNVLFIPSEKLDEIGGTAGV